MLRNLAEPDDPGDERDRCTRDPEITLEGEHLLAALSGGVMPVRGVAHSDLSVFHELHCIRRVVLDLDRETQRLDMYVGGKAQFAGPWDTNRERLPQSNQYQQVNVMDLLARALCG